MNLLKSFGAVFGILVIFLFVFQGCNSSTGSTSSSGTSSIPRVQIILAASSLQASQYNSTSGTYNWSSTFITVIVRDYNGNLVPAGTIVNIACGAGYLGDGDPIMDGLGSSITVTTNSSGQVQVKYTAPLLPPSLSTETATISAISMGSYGSAIITIGGTNQAIVDIKRL